MFDIEAIVLQATELTYKILWKSSKQDKGTGYYHGIKPQFLAV